MLLSSLQKKRIVGVTLLTGLLSVFLVFNRFPKLDIVREDLRAASSLGECFQGFCVDTGATLFSRWWEFSVTYLELVAPGMIFAFLVAGLTGAFLFPSSGTRAFSSGGIWGSFKGLIVGTPMSLCSACIVPISRALRGKGASIATTLAVVQGSATLNAPALIMVALIFTPLLGGSRILLSILAGLLIGPLVAWVVGERQSGPEGLTVDPIEGKPDSWKDVLVGGGIEWIRASLGYLLRLGPVMVLAGFISGLVIQWVSPEVVETYLGNNLQGVALAATLGILINVPLLFEVPLVVLLLLLGMGTAPAATLLFTAAAGGPITFWGLARSIPRRGIVTFAAATWLVGIVGGLGVFALGPFVPDSALGYRSTAIPAGSRGADIPAAPRQCEELTVLSDTDFDDPSAKIRLDFQGLQPLNNGYHYEVWSVNDCVASSLTRFNINEAGHLIRLDGQIMPEQSFPISPASILGDILITIEPPGEDDGRPSATRYLAGTIINGNAELTVVHPLALGPRYRNSSGAFILSSPSSPVGRKTIEWMSGIWWVDVADAELGMTAPGVYLPYAPSGWNYEGWVVFNGQPLTTGRFIRNSGYDLDDMPDSDAPEYSPYNGTDPVPRWPGEDFIRNPPEGLTFPTDIRGNDLFISIEPSPDDSVLPFTLHALTGRVPTDGEFHTTYELTNNSETYPTGTATVQ